MHIIYYVHIKIRQQNHAAEAHEAQHTSLHKERLQRDLPIWIGRAVGCQLKNTPDSVGKNMLLKHQHLQLHCDLCSFTTAYDDKN